MPIEVRVTGVRELQGGIARTPRVLEAELRQAMSAGLILLEADMRRNAPRDTGRLQGSVNHTITGTGANLTGRVGPSVAYAYWVEHGRRPGRYPPIGAMTGWARRHGIHPFLVARKIAHRGTRPQPFVRPAFERNRDRVIRLFERIGYRVATVITGGQ